MRGSPPPGAERPFDVGHGGHAADGCHIALVEVVERRARFAGEILRDHSGDMLTHLHSGLGDAGNLVATLLDGSEVAADKDFRMAWRVQSLADGDASTAVGFKAEQFAERRGLNACSP